MGAPKGNKNAVGNKGGHPKTGLDVLWEGWQDDILNLYSEGAEQAEIQALICQKTKEKTKASFRLWDRWMKEEIEFSSTIKEGKLLSEAWWKNQGRKNLNNKDFNSTLWYMNMKNRFFWSDKQEIHNTGTAPVTIKIVEKD